MDTTGILRLAAFVVAILVVLGAGAAIGSKVGPEPHEAPTVTTSVHDVHGR